jgi:hypothetical protein
MLTHCKLLGLLTPYQADTLKKLTDLTAARREVFWKPRDVGAFRNSHHAKTLSQLHSQDLVERKELSEGGVRPVYGYRASLKGVVTLELFRELAELPVEAVMGRAADRRCAALAQALCAA